MKKRLFRCVALIMLFLMLAPSVFATEHDTVYFEDGSSLEMTIQAVESRVTGTKSGTKTYTYKNSDGVVQWKAVLSGTFTYTGSSATCTASSCNVTIYENDWYVVSKITEKSGASALCELTMGYRVFGITTKKVPVSMALSCDADGKLS